jgi:hypothetical protein
VSNRDYVLVEVVRGSAGCCLCIGNENSAERVAGPKAWGGGTTIHSFKVSADDLRRLADEYAPNLKEPQSP